MGTIKPACRLPPGVKMARALMQSVMSLTIMLLMVAAVAAAASREESTIESEDSVMVSLASLKPLLQL